MARADPGNVFRKRNDETGDGTDGFHGVPQLKLSD
jgi:hypothetical protein